jgi:hypothetical protein
LVLILEAMIQQGKLKLVEPKVYKRVFKKLDKQKPIGPEVCKKVFNEQGLRVLMAKARTR